MRLGIIPARAGSKGLPGKNIMPIAGHPLIAWTISTAQESGVLDGIVVSTDGEEIEAVSRRYGAEVIIRPPNLATDEASAKAVIHHAVENVARSGRRVRTIIYLQPTSPLRLAADIIATLDLVESGGFDSAASFTPAVPHPERAFHIDDRHEANPAIGHEQVWKARQDRAPLYHLNGAVYVLDAEHGLDDREPQILRGRLGAHLMPAERSVDIDTLLDLEICALLLRDSSRRAPRQIGEQTLADGK